MSEVEKQDFTGRTRIGYLNVTPSERLEAIMLEFGIDNPRHCLNLIIEDKFKQLFHPNARLTLKAEVLTDAH